jgi:F-type H+-transporting ATPase subunit delta
MTEKSITAWADSLLAIAGAEGASETVREELSALATAVSTDDALRTSLTDERIAAADRVSAIEGALDGKAHKVTTALAGLVVGAGRVGDLKEITSEMARRLAEAEGASVAEVRSAVALSDSQIAQLADGLTKRMGRPIQVHNVVDSSVMGGLVTQIGDEVIDGSVRTRLNQLRDAF